MSDFNQWYFDLFEKGNGTCLNQQEIAEEAWNHQQQKIDSIKSKLHDIYDACDEDETVAEILDSIQELLK